MVCVVAREPSLEVVPSPEVEASESNVLAFDTALSSEDDAEADESLVCDDALLDAASAEAEASLDELALLYSDAVDELSAVELVISEF